MALSGGDGFIALVLTMVPVPRSSRLCLDIEGRSLFFQLAVDCGTQKATGSDVVMTSHLHLGTRYHRPRPTAANSTRSSSSLVREQVM